MITRSGYYLTQSGKGIWYRSKNTLNTLQTTLSTKGSRPGADDCVCVFVGVIESLFACFVCDRLKFEISLRIESDLFDTSGNCSKSWNKHICQYFSHRNLPQLEMLMQEYHVHFISTSQTAEANDQFERVKSIIKSSQQCPIRMYDSLAKKPVRVRLTLIMLAADIPMAGELAHHIGVKSNLFCRKCFVGGTQA